MVKAIFANSVGRKVVATAMFATAVMGANANNIMSNNNNFETKTEFVSKDVANAVKSRALKLHDEKIEQNKKINKLYLEKCKDNTQTKDMKKSLDAMYSSYGTYGATIELQKGIDDSYLDEMFNIFCSMINLSKSELEIVEQIFSQFYGWRDNVFYKDLSDKEFEFLSEGKKDSAEDAIKMVDNFVDNSEYFTEKERETYKKFSENFVVEQKNKVSVQAKSDLLAHKVHILNSLAFNKFLLHENKMPKENAFFYIYNEYFVFGDGTVKP